MILRFIRQDRTFWRNVRRQGSAATSILGMITSAFLSQVWSDY
jgi:hypothetical protein